MSFGKMQAFPSFLRPCLTSSRMSYQPCLRSSSREYIPACICCLDFCGPSLRNIIIKQVRHEYDSEAEENHRAIFFHSDFPQVFCIDIHFLGINFVVNFSLPFFACASMSRMDVLRIHRYARSCVYV